MHWLITRPANKSQKWIASLRKAKMQVTCIPFIESTPPKKNKKLKATLDALSTYDWLIVTSSETAIVLKKYIRRFPKKLQIVAVGESTKKELKSLGGKILLPDKFGSQKKLISFFKKQNIKQQRVLYPRSSLADKALSGALKKMGAKVTAITAYETHPKKVPLTLLRTTLKKVDGVFFFSPSQVKSFFDQVKAYDLNISGLIFATVGPTTDKYLQARWN